MMEHDPKLLVEALTTTPGGLRLMAAQMKGRPLAAADANKIILAHADLIERHAKLLKHAEALYEIADADEVDSDQYQAVLDAYRQDFPANV